ncbi:hypothetical protein ACELLULO517_25380 [Acidisoma cellulosilytica]|uniref:Uncharacterized protein n=1 Tax=Acidisoma cellulosilyticum TaxID=2802395 RepID=A0A964E6I4_9PROT|nr:hypothetical protein [Acidisoma cellulosilyticum]MCB8883606.1 hypothetical protein [Acidisoma cellulosilyticum]
MKTGLSLCGIVTTLMLMGAGTAMATPSLPACDSPEARSGIDLALKKSNAPFTVTGLAGITTDKQSDSGIACIAIATLSTGAHQPIGYKFRINNGKLQSWAGLFVMKGSK